MKPQSIMLIGGPDSGKTNYVARLSVALRSGLGRLILVDAQDIQYVEDALAHLLQGKFAPRSEKNIEESRRDYIATLSSRETGQEINLVVPDVTGELWKEAVISTELPLEWMEQLKASSGALLFVRVLSNLNVAPLDWVTARELMKLRVSTETTHDATPNDAIPTQVALCELIRFLQLTLKTRSDGKLPRVAIVITAWDLLDNEMRAAGPREFIASQYPLLAGRLKDVQTLDLGFFGVSIVGGDLDTDEDFRNHYYEADFNTCGYVMEDRASTMREEADLTLPIAWVTED